MNWQSTLPQVSLQDAQGLGLIPMVTGISYDFHIMEMTLTSESSQWWKSMASVVIFGLLLATVLTLVVVPTLYASIESAKAFFEAGYHRLRAFFPGSKQIDMN